MSNNSVSTTMETSMYVTTNNHQFIYTTCSTSHSDSNCIDFRHDLAFDNSIVIGHFTRNGVCLIDEEYSNLKRRLITHNIQIPKPSLQSLSSPQANEVLNYVNLSKSSDIIERPSEIQEDEWNMFVETWTALLKVPQMTSKLTGKHDNSWARAVFYRLYKFIIRDMDSVFEEGRELQVTVSSGSTNHEMKLQNLLLVGMEKTRDIRQSLVKVRQIYNRSTVDQQFSIGELMLPFFCSKEMSDKGSHFAAENELALALKSCLNCHNKFFLSKTAKRRQAVVGMTCVGSIVTGYVMRKKAVENEESVYVMQPVDSFNLIVYEDLMRLAKFLASTRAFGEELAQDARTRFKSLTSKSSDKTEERVSGKVKAGSPVDEKRPSTKRKPDAQKQSANSKKQRRESPTSSPPPQQQQPSSGNESDLDSHSDREEKLDQQQQQQKDK